MYFSGSPGYLLAADSGGITFYFTRPDILTLQGFIGTVTPLIQHVGISGDVFKSLF